MNEIKESVLNTIRNIMDSMNIAEDNWYVTPANGEYVRVKYWTKGCYWITEYYLIRDGKVIDCQF